MMSEREHDAMIAHIKLYQKNDMRSRLAARTAWQACSEWHEQAERETLREFYGDKANPLGDAMLKQGEENA